MVIVLQVVVTQELVAVVVMGHGKNLLEQVLEVAALVFKDQ